nr:hypothetical protein [Variovorax sp. E3]
MVVDHDLRAAAHQPRSQFGHLLALHLDLHAHAERRDAAPQRIGIRIVRKAQQRHVESNADHALCLQFLQLRGRCVVVHHGDALEAASAAADGVEHAAVVGAVARVGADQQRVRHAIRRHHLHEVVGRGDLAARGRVEHAGRIRKGIGVEDVTVAVDLRFGKNRGVHGRTVWHRAPRHRPATARTSRPRCSG